MHHGFFVTVLLLSQNWPPDTALEFITKPRGLDNKSCPASDSVGRGSQSLSVRRKRVLSLLDDDGDAISGNGGNGVCEQ
ncbi:hypothetical protein BU15DRAFT_84390 [Melanogaster broomeanus]|nr:hypothetical protein BU15DRAFT_84390 [Melanogaster broomeanus]